MSHYSRSAKYYKDQGIKTWKVEQPYNKFTGKRVDLFNIIDMIALDSNIVGVQICGADLQPHIKKLTVEHAENTREWLKSGGLLEIHTWGRRKYKRGLKRTIWKCRIVDVLLINNEIVTELRDF